MSNPNLINEDSLGIIQEANNYAVWSKEDGSYKFNDGSLFQCAGLFSPSVALIQDSIQIEDEDLI
jgi:hypothetical protein